MTSSEFPKKAYPDLPTAGRELDAKNARDTHFETLLQAALIRQEEAKLAEQTATGKRKPTPVERSMSRKPVAKVEKQKRGGIVAKGLHRQ